MSLNRFRSLALVLTAIAVAACGNDGSSSSTGPAIPPAVATVAVTPATDTIVIGDSARFTAIPKDASGAALSDRLVLWTVTDPTVLNIGSVGSPMMATAVGIGTATIGATSEHVQGLARVVVVPGPVFAVQVSPATSEIRVGQTVALQTIVKDSHGIVLPAAPVQYLTLEPSIATVSSSGVVSGVGAGDTKIIVTSSAVTDTARIRVDP